ncbi:MAG TPA: hypothetical protein VF148_03705 [Acidimicrobiia bacterium]
MTDDHDRPLGAAGVLLLGAAIATVMFAPLSPTLTRLWGSRVVCGIGFLLLIVSYAGMITVDRSTRVAVFELLLVFLGAGSALVIAPAIDLVMTSVPSERAGVGSAFSSAILSTGRALGIAVLGSVLSTGYRSRIWGSLDTLPAGVREAAGESIGGTQLIVFGIHDQLADHGRGLLEAASSAFAGAMHITAGLSAAAAAVALLIVLVWMPRNSTAPTRP